MELAINSIQAALFKKLPIKTTLEENMYLLKQIVVKK